MNNPLATPTTRGRHRALPPLNKEEEAVVTTSMISEDTFNDHIMRGDWGDGYGPEKGTFEYHILRLTKDKDVIMQKLAQWGKDRWELVGILPGGWRADFDYYYFRREGRA